MNITENEVANIEEIGTIAGNPVKMIRMKGGFYIAVGRKKGKYSEEALGAGSHPAIVKYNLGKQFPEYEPNMMKSEGFIEPIVEKHSHFLSDELRKGGHDIYSVQEGNVLEFHITKHNNTIAQVPATVDINHILLNELKIPKEFSKAIAGASVEKAISCEVGLKLKK